HLRLLACAPDAQGIIEHRNAVKVTGLTEQLAPPMDHRFDMRIAELRRLLHAPLKGFIVVTHKFQINANRNLAHMLRFVVCGLDAFSNSKSSRDPGLLICLTDASRPATQTHLW